MTRILSLASPGGSVALDGSNGIKAGLRMRGTGLPPVSSEWFEGPGDGAAYVGGRVLARVVDLPLKVYGIDRMAVADRLSLLGRIFAPPNQVRLQVDLDGAPWYIDVVRTGGGDWTWGEGTDGRTFVQTVLTVQGDPYWTSADVQQQVVEPGGLGLGLLGDDISLVTLTLSASSAFGSVNFTNAGDVHTYPVWTIRAPFSGFTLTSPSGEELVWGTDGDGVAGDPKESGYIVLDAATGTVVDEAGANAYGGLGPVPRFWAIPGGASTATIEVTGADGDDTRVEVVWKPRKWVMF